MKRRIAVFTSSRADLGPLGPVVQALDAEESVDLLVIATGTHLLNAFGGRLSDIRLSSRSVLEVLDPEMNGTTPSDLGEAYGRIARGISQILADRNIDVLVFLGDRWELLAAAGPALIHGVPIAHLHGGETTEGAIDERIRHGITKLADLHLCATEDSARRIRHLGEEPWRIVVTGAPGLDRLADVAPLTEARFEQLLNGKLIRPFGVVVYHPPTVDRSCLTTRARAVFDACAAELGSALVLYPGADPGAEVVIQEIERAVAHFSHFAAARNLGEEYLSALKTADVLVGNSSSGIIEAASLKLPVVDVGDRQRGRFRPANVIYVGEHKGEIANGIRRATSSEFKAGIASLVNPYGDGNASARIVRALLDLPLERLNRKPLVETAATSASLESMTISPDATLRDAMSAIDRGANQIAFVTDAEGRLLGSITDGDVRRALLGGASLSDQFRRYMTTVPVVATPVDSLSNIMALMERSRVTQLPVVDDDGKLIGVHLMRVVMSRAFQHSLPEPAS